MTLDPAAAHAEVDKLVVAHDAQEAGWRATTEAQTARIAELEGVNASLTATLTAARTRPATYEVQQGETMTGIAAAHGVTKDQVKGWNSDVVDPTKMPVGATVWLIDRATVPTSTQPEPDTDPPPTPTTEFSIDLSMFDEEKQLGGEWADRLAAHKAMLGTDRVRRIRLFIDPNDPLSWTDNGKIRTQVAALTERDSVLVTWKGNRTAEQFAAFVKATPAKLRTFPDQTEHGYFHEMEAECFASADPSAWIARYVANYALMNDVLEAEGLPFATPDGLTRIGLFYSQLHSQKLAERNTLARFVGGQTFGKLGMDCYHLQARLNARNAQGQPTGRYCNPEELFGYLIQVGQDVGLPVCVPEWGGTLANTDPDGSGRAKAIAEGGAYLQAHNVVSANWWDALGAKDASLPAGRRNHHLEQAQSNVDAYRALVA